MGMRQIPQKCICIKVLLQRRRMYVFELANRMNIGVSYLSEVLNGRKNLTRAFEERIYKALEDY